ncbi:MAG TPA: PilZ domain-containing protein [Myxococcota bacterium]|nr:PilZ domain-containing protein [Myxococcota bacterium]
MTDLFEALERRAHRRVKRQLACKVWIEGRCRDGIVRDLSHAGVRVETQAAAPAGKPVILVVDSPQGRPVVLRGTACRSRVPPLSLAQLAPAEMALRLQDPAPGSLRELERALGGAAR